MKKDLKLIPFNKNNEIIVHGRVIVDHGHLSCRFKLKDPRKKIIFAHFPEGQRTDELWKETCLEAFIYQPSTKQYLEINYSPRNGAWNSYLFESYRKRSSTQPAWSHIRSTNNSMGFSIPLNEIEKLLGPPPYQMALTAVIKCRDDSHYFALAHLDQVPNFHYSPSYIEPLKY